jgi:hypothetical protein
MFNLAIFYEETEKNLEKAFYWYQKAAENGDEKAMFNLALYYENGKGTKKNLKKAFCWYQKAAENGNEKAIFNLAICYKNGKGTEKNLEKAFYWQKVAESNELSFKNIIELCNQCKQLYTGVNNVILNNFNRILQSWLVKMNLLLILFKKHN